MDREKVAKLQAQAAALRTGECRLVLLARGDMWSGESGESTDSIDRELEVAPIGGCDQLRVRADCRWGKRV